MVDEAYIQTMKGKYPLSRIESFLQRMGKLSVLIIGDTILDQYVFVKPKGRAVKDPILSVEYKHEETYAGGILAVANHITSYADRITLITLVGDQHSHIDFIREAIGKNTHLVPFVKEQASTIIKRRYVDQYRNHKLFKIEYMNDQPITQALSDEIVSYLGDEIGKHDIVIVADFGHGFINRDIREIIEEKAKYLALNIQSNSANMGYNYVNHYKHPHFITLDEQEMRLPLMMRFEDVGEVASTFAKAFSYPHFLVTLGKQGCMLYNNGKAHRAPILTHSVVDTVGAGDAVFSIASLFAYAKAEDELLTFIANCAGALKTQYQGNKESVTREKLVSFIKGLYDS